MKGSAVVVVGALAALWPGRIAPGGLPGGIASGGSASEPSLFLARRARGAHAGLWELPGGKVEAGEDPETAMLRELREELGLEARLLGPARRYESRVEGRDFIFLVFPVDLGGEPPRLSDHDSWEYVPRSRLGEYDLAPLDSRPLADWIRDIEAGPGLPASPSPGP